MNRIFLLLLFLCFYLLGRPEYAHANNTRSTFFSAVKKFYKVQPRKSNRPHAQLKTLAGQDGDNYYFDIAEDQDEDDIFRKHTLLARYVTAFFYKYYLNNDERGINGRLPLGQLYCFSEAPRYIVLRVILI